MENGIPNDRTLHKLTETRRGGRDNSPESRLRWLVEVEARIVSEGGARLVRRLDASCLISLAIIIDTLRGYTELAAKQKACFSEFFFGK